MPSKTSHPITKMFKSFIKKGVPCTTAVQTIAHKTGKSMPSIYSTLCKAGLCCKQKINNTWIYWPTNAHKSTPTNAKLCQANLWQCFVEWCIASGCCTPKQLKNYTGNSKNFMNFCRNFFNRQWTTSPMWKTTNGWFVMNGNSFTWKPAKKSSTRRTTSKRRATTRTSTLSTRTSPTWSSSKRHTTKTWKPSRSGSMKNYKFSAYRSRPTSRRYSRAA